MVECLAAAQQYGTDELIDRIAPAMGFPVEFVRVPPHVVGGLNARAIRIDGVTRAAIKDLVQLGSDAGRSNAEDPRVQRLFSAR
jgi:hypothetical protein